MVGDTLGSGGFAHSWSPVEQNDQAFALSSDKINFVCFIFLAFLGSLVGLGVRLDERLDDIGISL